MNHPVIYTVGHSNVSAEELAAKLAAFGVELLVDVRRYPSSRRYPHFNGPVLARYLEGEHGIDYLHDERLGGHRRPRPESPHTALRNASIRAYADHMDTAPFRQAVADLIHRARGRTVALMCAEADPERCHRRLLSDALLARGCEVRHILSPTEARPHELHPRAHVEGDRVGYPDLREAQMPLFG